MLLCVSLTLHKMENYRHGQLSISSMLIYNGRPPDPSLWKLPCQSALPHSVVGWCRVDLPLHAGLCSVVNFLHLWLRLGLVEGKLIPDLYLGER
jgi:hypothetical protein